MSNTFFTSDTHFGHHKSLNWRYQWDSVEQMDEALVANWNSVVGPQDVVYHLGDVSFHDKRTTASILRRLNGHIHLVPGNHDDDTRRIRGVFASVHDVRYVRLVLPDK